MLIILLVFHRESFILVLLLLNLSGTFNTGATSHMTPHSGMLSSLRPYIDHDRVLIGDGSLVSITHSGDFSFPISSTKSFRLNNILDQTSHQTLLTCASHGPLYSVPSYVIYSTRVLHAFTASVVSTSRSWHMRFIPGFLHFLLCLGRLLLQSRVVSIVIVIVRLVNWENIPDVPSTQ
ncbi:hypothetical protein LIER_33237 [Lithospermum erythrorhizon]|uniref:Retrovirus-related Pol polyprotein from transposon TNT 1-94-like beta-barrel domain-containing protein n=1 Tax=Lithospermum erythrorhizon TaxID=34254 RepID=A0AAV3RX16_LITER